LVTSATTKLFEASASTKQLTTNGVKILFPRKELISEIPKLRRFNSKTEMLQQNKSMRSSGDDFYFCFVTFRRQMNETKVIIRSRFDLFEIKLVGKKAQHFSKSYNFSTSFGFVSARDDIMTILGIYV